MQHIDSDKAKGEKAREKLHKNATSYIEQVVQLVSCGVLPPGLVQDCTQHSCVIAV